MKPNNEKNQNLGILAGITSGVFWGLPFFAPQLSPNFSAIEIAFGRFFFFGLISLFFFRKVMWVVRSVNLRERIQLFILAALGFWLYSTLLFWGVQQTGGVVSSLVIGLLPITIPLFTPDRQTGGPRFYFGIFALLLGLIVLFAWPLYQGVLDQAPVTLASLSGLLVALAMWTSYAILNSRFLKRNPSVNPKDLASVMGVISLVCIIPLFLSTHDIGALISREGFTPYLICAVALGFGSSWLANWLWNICAYSCPSEISGPLIVSETIFGLIYTFGYEARPPYTHESIAIGLFLIGVYYAVTAGPRKIP